jgi:hypothetical protein
MLHSAIFPPVLQGEQEFVFDVQFRIRLAAVLMQFFMGCVKDFQHLAKGGYFYAEEPFELGIAGFQCLLHAFGDDEHCRQKGKSGLDGQ